jgi:hypothetical protein
MFDAVPRSVRVTATGAAAHALPRSATHVLSLVKRKTGIRNKNNTRDRLVEKYTAPIMRDMIEVLQPSHALPTPRHAGKLHS